MKLTGTKIFLTMAQLSCFIVAPVIFVWMQCVNVDTVEEVAQTYKISVTAIVVIIASLYVFKNIVLKGFLAQNTAKIANYESLATTTTDPNAIKTLKAKYKLAKVVELVSNCLIPAFLYAIALLTCEALEKDVIELYGVLGVVGIMWVFGVLFKLLEIMTCKTPHEKK